MLMYVTCPNSDGKKQWLLKPLMDLNDSSVADGSVLGHDSGAGVKSIRGRSCLVVVLFCCSSKAACSGLPSAAVASLSQAGQGIPGTSSAGFWFCTCLGITSSTSVLTRAQGTSDSQVVLPCWPMCCHSCAGQHSSFCSFQVVPCSYRRVTALDVSVTTALAHPHCTSQLGRKWPVPCVTDCACAPSPRRA